MGTVAIGPITPIPALLISTSTSSAATRSMSSVTVTSTAKDVTELHRTGEVDGDVYRYSITMAAVGLPLTHHLEAELHRVTG